jgi:Lin1244/Lin1753-like, N-terminal
MSRPRKQTVDWFPHSCTHGRTMFVLERRWGITGYGFWFKLLEMLGNTEGHFIDAENKSAMDYLQAYTYTDKDTCFQILDQLADLDAIDPILWKDKIIWTDNFVAGLAVLYRNRNVPLPTKPDNYRHKSGLSGISTAGNPQRERVERESRERERETQPVAPASPPPHLFFSCPYFDVDFDYRMKIAKEYPALTDELLLKEFSKMEDYISDHPKKYSFKANGHLGNPKGFIRRWLENVNLKGSQLFPGPGGPGSPGGRGSGLKKWMEKPEHPEGA